MALLLKPASPTPSNAGLARSFQRDTEKGIKVQLYRGFVAKRCISVPMCDQSTACNPHWHIRSRGRMHKSSCGHLSKRRSNSPRRVLENKFIFTNLLSNGICMMPEVKKVLWLILIIIKMSMASTSGNFFFLNCWSSLCQLHKMELN